MNVTEVIYLSGKENAMNSVGIFFYNLIERKIKEGVITIEEGKIKKIGGN